MHIILAKPRGFCAGVSRAIETLEAVIKNYPPPITVYHELVHNSWVVDSFKRQGVRFVDTLTEVPDGSVLLFSAHGVAPSIREEAAQKNLVVIDATCPLVEQVHKKTRKYASQGYTILYLGHPGHDEVVAVLAEAPDKTVLISDEAQIANLHFPGHAKLVCLMQTTLAVDESREILTKLQERFPLMKIPSSGEICYATQNRQEAVRRLAPESDLVIVIGSANSSNSRRLAELAESLGIHSHLVDAPEMIEEKWFSGNETVLITSGASAPEEVVQLCVRALQSRFDATLEEKIICEENVKFSLPDVPQRSPES